MATFLETKITLGDITDPRELGDWVPILLAVFLVDLTVIFLVRYFPDTFGKYVNVWYDNFGIDAVLADVLIIALGIWVARYIYNPLIAPTYGFSPLYFLLLLLGVQLVHDVIFYVGVIKPLPEKHNEMIDVMHNYAKENGWKILLADAGMIVGAGGLAMLLKEQTVEVQLSLALLGMYALPYALYIRNKWSP
jgi:hypothetical protein